MSCALECYDVQLDPIVLEMRAQVGGQINEIPFHVRNVAGGADDDATPFAAGTELGGLPDRARLSWRLRRDPPRRAVGAVGRPTARGGRHRDHHGCWLPAAADGDFGGDVTYQLGLGSRAICRRPRWSWRRRQRHQAPGLPGSESPVTRTATVPAAGHRGRGPRCGSGGLRSRRLGAR